MAAAVDIEWTNDIRLIGKPFQGRKKEEEAHMRLFWSVVLAAGLLLVGMDVYESRREARDGKTPQAVTMMEDGTPLPPPPPPPPPR